MATKSLLIATYLPYEYLGVMTTIYRRTKRAIKNQEVDILRSSIYECDQLNTFHISEKRVLVRSLLRHVS